MRIHGPLTVDGFLSRVAAGEFGFEDEACASVDFWFSLREQEKVEQHFGTKCWETLRKREDERFAVDQDATPTDPGIVVRPATDAAAGGVAQSLRPSGSLSSAGSSQHPGIPKPFSPPPNTVFRSSLFLRLLLFVLGTGMGTVIYLVFRLLRRD